ncbi:hypothetical protein M422DRAFT_250655 [Sphaerobolus stellatus SS14]|uniref:Uncharacterized protein n=1 Tax=Sphaerobolus stellatus (strain SS14) TaxID=990650 RepID=A0A0C9VTG3_SPHS4|nr:hypothetical protein M422DRAFT_250655 [Sphaerobolus stellatus SS14]
MPPYVPSRRTRTTSPPSEDQFEGFGNQAVSVSTAKGAEIDMEEINRIFETHKPKSNTACNLYMVLDEVTEGFRPGQKKHTPKKRGKGGCSDRSEMSTALHQVVFLPYEFEDSDLSGLHVPTPRQVDILVTEGFTIRTAMDEELTYPNNLKSYTDIDNWLQSLLPKVFNSTFLHDPFTYSQVWSLLHKCHRKFELEMNNPISVNLRRTSRTVGRGWMDQDLFFTTAFPIPDIVEKLQPSGSGASKPRKCCHSSSDDSDQDSSSSDVSEIAAGSSSETGNTASHPWKHIRLLKAAKSISNMGKAEGAFSGSSKGSREACRKALRAL